MPLFPPFNQIPSMDVSQTKPQTVLAAKRVELALVTFTDEFNAVHTTLAVVGDNQVHLLEGRELGLSKNTTPVGLGSEWLRKGVKEKLSQKVTT